MLHAPADALIDAEVRFLAPSGERHEARAQRLELPSTSVGALAGRRAQDAGPLERHAQIDGQADEPLL